MYSAAQTEHATSNKTGIRCCALGTSWASVRNKTARILSESVSLLPFFFRKCPAGNTGRRSYSQGEYHSRSAWESTAEALWSSCHDLHYTSRFVRQITASKPKAIFQPSQGSSCVPLRIGKQKYRVHKISSMNSAGGDARCSKLITTPGAWEGSLHTRDVKQRKMKKKQHWKLPKIRIPLWQ